MVPTRRGATTPYHVRHESVRRGGPGRGRHRRSVTGSATMTPSRPLLRQPASLTRQVGTDLRRRILAREFVPGERLPSEPVIAAEYGVSRVTVRTALRTLQSQGLVDVRHGAGTFVVDAGSEILTGIQDLQSLSDTIREMGHVPGMRRHRWGRRPATPDEALRLDAQPGEHLLEIERTILADDRPVAFSYDLIPARFFPDDRGDGLGTTSVFAALEQRDIYPARAVARVHAVLDETIGWGAHRPDPALYLLLDQLHYNRRGMAIMHSRTYFIEGRFQFVVNRVR